ncbi:MAG: T9SS type A sorting domain-containing protein [Gilvibacter sp.]
MKTLFTFSCTFLIWAGVNAQTDVTVTEDFDAGLPVGWSTVVNTGTCDWFNGADMPTGPDFPTPAMYFDDDACGNGADASNTTLFSDVYDLSDRAKGTLVIIAYEVAFQEVASGETFTAEVKTDSGWELLATYETDLPEILSEDFNGLASNADFQLRWTYDDAGGAWGWHGAIDNFGLDYTLSSDDNQIAGFSMYPNPAIDVVSVRAANEIQNVTFYNVLGQKVLTTTPNGLSQEINIAALKVGVYFVNVVSDEQQGTYRLIKQ